MLHPFFRKSRKVDAKINLFSTDSHQALQPPFSFSGFSLPTIFPLQLLFYFLSFSPPKKCTTNHWLVSPTSPRRHSSHNKCSNGSCLTSPAAPRRFLRPENAQTGTVIHRSRALYADRSSLNAASIAASTAAMNEASCIIFCHSARSIVPIEIPLTLHHLRRKSCSLLPSFWLANAFA